jgi:hypothetical protein
MTKHEHPQSQASGTVRHANRATNQRGRQTHHPPWSGAVPLRTPRVYRQGRQGGRCTGPPPASRAFVHLPPLLISLGCLSLFSGGRGVAAAWWERVGLGRARMPPRPLGPAKVVPKAPLVPLHPVPEGHWRRRWRSLRVCKPLIGHHPAYLQRDGWGNGHGLCRWVVCSVDLVVGRG